MTQTTDADIANLSFEEAMDQLRQIVETMERGEAKLDDSIAAFERGSKLRAHCEAKLKEAKLRIDQISLSPTGEAKLETFQEVNPSQGQDAPF